MKKKGATAGVVTRLLFAVSIVCFSLSAHQGSVGHWSHKKYGLTIPPTDTTLLSQENQRQDQLRLKNINSIVERVVSEEPRARKQKSVHHKKKKKKYQHSCSSCDHNKIYSEQTRSSTDFVGEEVRRLLDEQYQDSQLQSQLVTVKFNDVRFHKAIELLSKLTAVDLIIDADVDGNIRHFVFHETPLSTVLQVLLKNNIPRLALIKEWGAWRILKQSTAIQEMIVKAEQSIERDTVTDHRVIYHLTWNADFKKRIEQLWHGIVGKMQTRAHYIAFDDESRTIFYRGRTQFVTDFSRALTEIDRHIPQVRIDARVVIVSKDFEENIGFEWSGVYDRSAHVAQRGYGFAGVGIGDKSATTNIPAMTSLPGTKDLLGWALNFLPTAIRDKRTIKIPFIFGNKNLDSRRLNIMLNAAEDRKELETILKPSMLVKSCEAAEILVGQEMPHETRLQETVEGSPTNVTTVSYKDVGMKIKVKPVVSPDNKSVFLDIYVQNSFIDKSRVMATDDTSRLGSFPYTIVTSRSQSRVLLSDGQTTMISGLVEHTKDRLQTGIPWVQELPVVGWLFRGKRKQLLDKQLLIFITPTLV